jgi:hypothetical protein
MLDSVWGPHQVINWRSPDATIVWQIIDHYLTALLSGPVTEKLIISAILFITGLTGYFLGRRLLPPMLAWTTGTLYLLNPFAYERLVAGQWIVLAGYAALPLSLGLAWDALQSKGHRAAYRWLVLFATYPLISPHFAYMNAFLCVGMVLLYCLLERPTWLRSRRTVWWALAAGAATLVANLIWLRSSKAGYFGTFTSLDFTTFRTASDPVVGVWGNVIGLYGFWRGSAFIEPKDLLGSVWIIIAAIIVLLSVTGALRAAKERNALALALAAAIPFCVVLAVGYSSPFTKPLTEFLMQYLPGFKGLRDSEKLVGVVALAYATLAPYGAQYTQKFLTTWRPVRYAVPVLLVLFAAISTTGIWADAGGQIPLANYPTGWYSVRTILNRTPHQTVVVLPWHEYLNLDFTGSYVAQPAGVFFNNPLLSSDELDNILVARPDNLNDRLMLKFTNGQIAPSVWASALAGQGARYVVLEKTDDWASYAPKLAQTGMTQQFQDNTIALYSLPATHQ